MGAVCKFSGSSSLFFFCVMNNVSLSITFLALNNNPLPLVDNLFAAERQDPPLRHLFSCLVFAFFIFLVCNTQQLLLFRLFWFSSSSSVSCYWLHSITLPPFQVIFSKASTSWIFFFSDNYYYKIDIQFINIHYILLLLKYWVIKT